MPNYGVQYKTSADDDGRFWPIGPVPDRDQALGIFNAVYAKKEGIGPFTFEETSNFLPDYNLVERIGPLASDVMYPLYKIEH
jgi:hypothetical protein